MTEMFLVLLLIIFVVLLVYVSMGVKIVRPYQKGVVEQLGRYKGTAQPGLRLIFPVVQRIRTVDMREQVIDVPPQEVITEDNVAVSVDAVIYFEPTDPQRLLYNISNFVLAVTKLAQTNLRNVIGEMTLDEAFTSRERVNAALRQILDDATDKWGVRVVRVEIQRIDPPQDVMHAMHEQMKAERNRRAVVTEAEGARESAVTRAEGEKASAILTAEGVKQREILTAEGSAQAVKTRADAEQYRQEVVAHGEADAIRSVYTAINQSGTDDRVIAIKYLETLQGIADGRATKIFVPADMSAALGSIGGIAELLRGDGDNGGSGGGDNASEAKQLPRRPAPVPATSGSARRSATIAPEQTSNPPLPPQPSAPPPPASPPGPRPS
ncbi:MAG: SPFH/Band 7/PHB domain protein [Actinomycetia bacterium]|nr:SPFH/Band 7/PHB domain protein [Actinomycetes bacterium]MCP5035226.1 SPFH/Band 7/PHB domain protein [Actinomycetes bacterium]